MEHLISEAQTLKHLAYESIIIQHKAIPKILIISFKHITVYLGFLAGGRRDDINEYQPLNSENTKSTINPQ